MSAEDFMEYYANDVHLSWTLTDATLHFVQMGHDLEGANYQHVVVTKAQISIPWWTAKVLHDMIGEMLRSHENVNGEIRRPVLAPIPEFSKPVHSSRNDATQTPGETGADGSPNKKEDS